jgi:hypothetical protein
MPGGLSTTRKCSYELSRETARTGRIRGTVWRVTEDLAAAIHDAALGKYSNPPTPNLYETPSP